MNHDREEQLFEKALLLAAEERSAYLDAVCHGDGELRRRLEALLRAHDAAEGFMQRPAASRGEAEPGSVPAGSDDQPGMRIGRYKLLQQIGEGGCGVVWMAEQEEPVRRRVALKVIKLGMDTKAVIARFDAERQALALMDHPNIARVLDAGATATGRPYFVMELVRGVPITEYCDQHHLTTAQRLQLFVQVCQAVQHAHQKGIIHRDLKPSNVLVTQQDAEPTPKVIDFGIAKATQGRLTNQTLFTAFEQFIGTPAYMSPEQAEMSGTDIDTRSDIYSLGVLLYELLTGRPPFDPKTLLDAGLDEIRRIIREVEPPKPSTRLGTLAEAEKDTAARQRGIAPSSLSVLLRGDLDWIVMKAMEKRRNLRYETASGLARDIERHLKHEPVSARPPTAAYRLSRTIRRHRLVFAAAASVALALIAGIVVSTAQALRARRAERVAEQEQVRAQAERARAEDLLGFMLGDLRRQLAKVGRLDVLESTGDRALAYFVSREAQELDDAALARYAKALTQIGELRMDQTRYDDAAKAFAAAYERAAAVVSRHPEDATLLFERGQAEYWNGFVHWRRGELARAAEWLQRYHDTSAALAARDPNRAEWQSELAYGKHNLAVLNKERGEFAAARTGFLDELVTLEAMRAAAPGDPELRFRLADAHSWLGGIASQVGELRESLAQYHAQADLLGHLVADDPRTPRWRFRLSNAQLYETEVLLALGELTAADEKLRECTQRLQELVAHDSANRSWQTARLHARLLEVLLTKQASRFAEAAKLAHDARLEAEKLAEGAPSDRLLQRWKAWSLRLEAHFARWSGNPIAATELVERARQCSEQLSAEARLTDADVGEFALISLLSGELAESGGQAEEAKRHWEQAAAQLAPRLLGSRDWRLLDPAARISRRLGHTEQAAVYEAQLREIGYVTLEGWPTGNALDGAASKSE